MQVCVRPRGLRQEEFVGLSYVESAVGCQCSLSWCPQGLERFHGGL